MRASTPVHPSVADRQYERQELAVVGIETEPKVRLNANEFVLADSGLQLDSGAAKAADRLGGEGLHSRILWVQPSSCAVERVHLNVYFAAVMRIHVAAEGARFAVRVCLIVEGGKAPS